ncbi:neurofilament medium polypeptide-like [Oncorhynchus nerka]
MSEAPKAAEEKVDKKSDSEEERKVEKKDAAMNGDVEKITPEDKDKKDEGGKEAEEKDVISNGVDESPTKDDPDQKDDPKDQKVVITKTVETITTGEDGAKHVTKSVTVTETVKESEDVMQEKTVSSKKMEKHSSQSVKVVTETE